MLLKMKTIKHTLLILLLAVCITSCASDETVNQTFSSEMLKQTDSAKKAAEANNSSGYGNINVDVDDVKYVWQKNLLWFLTRHITP